MIPFSLKEKQCQSLEFKILLFLLQFINSNADNKAQKQSRRLNKNSAIDNNLDLFYPIKYIL